MSETKVKVKVKIKSASIQDALKQLAQVREDSANAQGTN